MSKTGPRTPTPPPWADAMRRTQNLSQDQEPSQRELTRQAQALSSDPTWPSHTMVRNAILGKVKGPVDPELIRVLARALREDFTTVADWLGTPAPYGPWTLPPAALQLTPQQRELLDALIRTLAEANRRAGESRGNTAPMTDEVTIRRDGDALAIEAGDPDAPSRPSEKTTPTSDI